MAGRTLASWCSVAVCSIVLHGQQGTDFSGSWVLEDGTAASAEIPARLTVQQPIATTTTLGAPMPAAYLTITVHRHFANTVRDETYFIGTFAGVVGGTPGKPSKSSAYATGWKENALWIQHKNFTESGSLASERTELWRLDEAGRLIVTLEITDAGKVETRTLAFRREQ